MKNNNKDDYKFLKTIKIKNKYQRHRERVFKTLENNLKHLLN